jgi:integrase
MRARIGVREVRALEPNTILWDAAVIGFGVRRQRGDAAVFFLKYRTQAGRQRWIKIGRFGSPWNPDNARDEARRLLGDIARGEDPAAKRTRRGITTMTQLCDAYLADVKAGKLQKKSSTIATDESRLRKHILPMLGNLPATAVGRDDIENFLHTVAANSGKGTATRSTNLLGAVFKFAIRNGLRSDNPCVGVKRFADGKRERRFSDEEYGRLGAALGASADQSIWPAAILVVRFIALTGWRSGEVLALRWDEVDLPRRTATLPDTKSGRSMRALSQAACEMLTGIPRTHEMVFQRPPGASDHRWFESRWRLIFRLGNLPSDLLLHTLRHSFASLAADLGYSEPVVASLLGHKGRSVTSRYIHSADSALLAAADAVAGKIAELMR